MAGCGNVLYAIRLNLAILNEKWRFSYDAQGKVVAVDYSENGGSTYTTYYYIRNAQGDIVKLIDGSGNTVVEYTYDSWGKVLAVTGTLESTLGENQPFRYRGYVYDSDTNLYYLQSRYYNPSLGRFISSDIYLSTGQGVLGHNSYAYCLNNPHTLVDSGGTMGLTIAIGGVTITFASIFAMAVAACMIIDLCINQEQSLVCRLLDALQTVVVESVETVQTIWDSIVLSKTKNPDPDPNARPGQKKQGRELKNKARKSPKWTPRKPTPKPPKHHTPGRDHRKYSGFIFDLDSIR
ncbi:MAG: hypothetical protein IKZ82_01270 [Clostridia bacterium]|nr:hypothetical protein [Clostridia bacterium]